MDQSVQPSFGKLEGFKMDSLSKNKKYEELYEFLNQHKNRTNPILLSIVLPMFNEENTIRQILEDLPLNDYIEIIVVDDHSTDGSIREVQKVKAQKRINLIVHKKNRGYGGAIITGLKNANGDVIVTMDSDGQHSSIDILNLIKPIFKGKAEITIGSRYLGIYHYTLPLSTRLGEVIIEKLVQIIFGYKIMNNQNGFRAFDKKVISIFEKVRYLGFAFATEVIILAILSDYRVKECPIILFDREYGSSRVVLPKLAIDIFSCIFRYFFIRIKKIFQRKLK